MVEINYSAKERAKNVLMKLKDRCIENGDLEVIGAIEVYDDLIERLLVHMDAIEFANRILREKLDMKGSAEHETCD